MVGERSKHKIMQAVARSLSLACQSVTQRCVGLASPVVAQKCIGIAYPVVNRFLHTSVLQSIDTANKFSSTLLQPSLPSLTLSCGMKVKVNLKKRCSDCYFVMRQGRMYVMCKSHGRHKQMAPVKKAKRTWILSHVTTGPQGPFPYYRKW